MQTETKMAATLLKEQNSPFSSNKLVLLLTRQVSVVLEISANPTIRGIRSNKRNKEQRYDK